MGSSLPSKRGAENGLSLPVRAKNASSVVADIQTGADTDFPLQRGTPD
jgi:hypothetical protein